MKSQWIHFEEMPQMLPPGQLSKLKIGQRPEFLQFAKSYLEANFEILEKAGYANPSVSAGYQGLFLGGEAKVLLPILRLESDGRVVQSIPERTKNKALILLAEEFRDSQISEWITQLEGKESFFYFESIGYWDLRPSLFKIFSNFSNQEKEAMAKASKKIILVEGAWDKDQELFWQFQKRNLQRKKLQNITLHRPYSELYRLFNKGFTLLKAQLKGESVGLFLLIRDLDHFFLIDFIGGASFQKDSVFPQSLLKLLGWVQSKGGLKLIFNYFDGPLQPYLKEIFQKKLENPEAWVRDYHKMKGRGLQEWC